jgi:DNA topoisomerase VI subunit A
MQNLNKRALYYILLKHFNNQAELDDILTDICFILSSSRESIGIHASAKGLLSGQITMSQEIDYMQIPAKYTFSLQPSIFK